MTYYDDYLEHHGIKGQKWGVRRFQRTDGMLTPAGKKRVRERELTEYEKARYKYDANGRRVRKSIKNMTNEELEEAAERYELEEKYKSSRNDFKETNTKVASTGGKIVGSILLSSGLVLMKHALTDDKVENESAEAKAARYKKIRNEVLLSSGTVAISVIAASKDLEKG